MAVNLQKIPVLHDFLMALFLNPPFLVELRKSSIQTTLKIKNHAFILDFESILHNEDVDVFEETCFYCIKSIDSCNETGVIGVNIMLVQIINDAKKRILFVVT